MRAIVNESGLRGIHNIIIVGYHTNSKNLKFGDKIYMNKNGFVQKRETVDGLGWFIKYGDKMLPSENKRLYLKLEKFLIKNPKSMYFKNKVEIEIPKSIHN